MRPDELRGAVIRIELLHAGLIAGVCVVLLPMRLAQPGALVAGGLFMGLNFLLLSCGIRWVLTPFAGKGRIRTGVLLLVLKLGLFLGVMSALFWRVQLDPLSFTLGFSSLLVAIFLDRLWALSSTIGA